MTQSDRIDELDRQLTLIERRGPVIVVCPWCGAITNEFRAENPDCCLDFRQARDSRGIEKLETLKRNHRRMLNGEITCLSCPYCHKHNYRVSKSEQHPAEWKRPNVSPFCCDLFALAVKAICYAMAEQKLQDDTARIADEIARGKRYQ